MRFIDLGLTIVLGLTGCFLSGSPSFSSAFQSALFFLTVLAALSLARSAMRVPGKPNPLALAPLLVWPHLFSASGHMNISWAGLLAIVGFGLTVFLDSSRRGWKRASAVAAVSCIMPAIGWFIYHAIPPAGPNLLSDTAVFRLGAMAAAATILLLVQKDQTASLFDPRGISLAGAVVLGFSLGFRFLSGIYISVNSLDYLALLVPLLAAIFAGVFARTRNLAHFALSLAWVGIMGPLGFALMAGPGLALMFLGRDKSAPAAFALGGGALVYLGALPWAKDGVIGFVPPGLAIGLATLFFAVAFARALDNRWARAITSALGYLILAAFIRSLPAFTLSAIFGTSGFLVALLRPRYMWWLLGLFTLLLSGLSFVSPWSLRKRPEGLETALRGRELFRVRDYSGALDALSRSAIGPTDCLMAAKAASLCGHDPSFLYESGISRFPRDKGLYLSYLRHLYAKGHEARLILWARKALTTGIVDPFVLRALGKGLLISGQYTEGAQAFFSQFLLGDPDGLLYLADIYQKPELFKEAELRGANFAEVYRDLVQIHLMRGDENRAVYYLDALLASYPEDTGLRSLRERLRR
ncbi:MAG: hypothetical protein ABIN66_05650 [candidate division WOR-3 bacterium]